MFGPRRRARRLAWAVTAAAALSAAPCAAGLAAPAQAAQSENIIFHHYATAADFASGTFDGTRPASASGGITLAGTGLISGAYTDPVSGTTVSYDSGSWTSPWFATGFPFYELVSSWNAATPPGSWLKVQMQAETGQSVLTKWYTMGIWAFDTSTIHRTSVNGQGDANGTVATDTFFAKDHPMVAYRLQVMLYRASGTSATPALREVGAVASDAPKVNLKPYVPSPLGGAEGMVLSLPEYSQEIHTGEYPEFDGGGEAWCSPTSTDMVTTHWGTGPSAADLASMPPSSDPAAVQPTQDLSVDWTAMHTFDYAYDGTGNWPFNIAYAAHYGLDGEVTQLHSMYEVEQFIKARHPGGRLDRLHLQPAPRVPVQVHRRAPAGHRRLHRNRGRGRRRPRLDQRHHRAARLRPRRLRTRLAVALAGMSGLRHLRKLVSGRSFRVVQLDGSQSTVAEPEGSDYTNVVQLAPASTPTSADLPNLEWVADG